jgi:hypothetical protein
VGGKVGSSAAARLVVFLPESWGEQAQRNNFGAPRRAGRKRMHAG